MKLSVEQLLAWVQPLDGGAVRLVVLHWEWRNPPSKSATVV